MKLSVRNWDVLINALSPHKWWSTIKSAVDLPVGLGSLPACWRETNVTYSEGSTVLLCCQLLTDFNNISIVLGVSASTGVSSPRTDYGTQWCASNH